MSKIKEIQERLEKGIGYGSGTHANNDIAFLLDMVKGDDIIKRDLAMLVRRLCNGSQCQTKAMDYLERKGLLGTVLRKEAEGD